eukprot:3399858-Prymnesium_polylepis.1
MGRSSKSKGRRVPSLIEDAGAASSSRLIGTSSDGLVKLLPQGAEATLAAPPPPTALELPTRPKRTKASDTAGAGWGHMVAPELTKEVKRELLVVKMRGSIDPKKFYRSSDHKNGLPKYFQVCARARGRHAIAVRPVARRTESSVVAYCCSVCVGRRVAADGDDNRRRRVGRGHEEAAQALDARRDDGRRQGQAARQVAVPQGAGGDIGGRQEVEAARGAEEVLDQEEKGPSGKGKPTGVVKRRRNAKRPVSRVNKT